MKSKLLKLYLTSIVFSIIIIGTITVNSSVYAWYIPTNNKTSFSVGAKYSDADSTGHATNAHNRYSQMGMTNTKLITSPTTSNLRGVHSNSVPYLQSGIVFINGHSEARFFEFPNNTYIWNKDYHSGEWVGIGAFDNTKTALYVMAGCNTASEANNITKYVVDRNAKTSIGWTTKLPSASFKNWNNRFNDKIKDKVTSVYNAASSANNHIYVDNRVKNWKIYGATNYNPWYFINGTTSRSLLDDTNEEMKLELQENEHMVNINLSNKVDIESIAEQYIKEKLNVNFDKNDYVIEINGNDVKYYDYVLYVGKIRTSIGYTIIQGNNNIKIIDNTANYKIEEVKNKVNLMSHNISNSIIGRVKQKAIVQTKMDNKEVKKLKIENEMPYYDAKEDKLYYATFIESINESGSIGIDEYLMEIN